MEKLFYIFILLINILSAALFFWIQPLIAKIFLPVFGGVASVWTTCVLFFQILLFLGYSYAHLLSKYLINKKTIVIYSLFLLCAILFLPISKNVFDIANLQKSPVLNILISLCLFIGFPVFVLSITSPLTQKLLHLFDSKKFSNPYHLYVACNLGSTIGLLGFVFAFEPLISVKFQVSLWSFVYYIFLALGLSISVMFYLRHKKDKILTNANLSNEQVQDDTTLSSRKVQDDTTLSSWNSRSCELSSRNSYSCELSSRNSRSEYPGSLSFNNKSTLIKWFCYSFIPVGILLSITEYVSTEIASLPFLWVIPLFLYLFSFQVTFTEKKLFTQKTLNKVFTILLITTLITMRVRSVFVIFVHFFNFFILCVWFHKKLYNIRPSANKLTGFYCLLSFAGIIAGLLNVFVYPVIFTTYIEYFLFSFVVLLFLSQVFNKKLKFVTYSFLVLAFVFSMSSMFNKVSQDEVLLQARNFYGVNKIVKSKISNVNILFNNGVIQGAEKNDPNLGYVNKIKTSKNKNKSRLIKNSTKNLDESPCYVRGDNTSSNLNSIAGSILKSNNKPVVIASTYFSKVKPLIESLQNKKSKINVAVAGLGTGTLACYAREQDYMSFYELNPLIKEIATNPKYFTYLKKCPAKGGIHMGDARLNLEKAKNNSFDMIIIDVYNKASIPIHLLTYEALNIYKQKLQDDGIIAIHISNGFFDLLPVIKVLSQELNMKMWYLGEKRQTPFDSNRKYKLPARWAVLAKNSNLVKEKNINLFEYIHEDLHKFALWTDDYANIFQALF